MNKINMISRILAGGKGIAGRNSAVRSSVALNNVMTHLFIGNGCVFFMFKKGEKV